MLHFRGEELAYGSHTVFSGLDLDIVPGECVALLGRSGAGKSTLLSAAYERLKRADMRTALVPQEHGLVPQLSVFHNVFMGRLDDRGAVYNLSNLVWPRRTERREIGKVLDMVGLDGLERKAVEGLSGGQKQRTALARAIHRGGRVLLGDEPVSAVDEKQAADLVDLLASRFETVIVALHDVAPARRVATRLIGIADGRIVIDGSPDHIGESELNALYRA